MRSPRAWLDVFFVDVESDDGSRVGRTEILCRVAERAFGQTWALVVERPRQRCVRVVGATLAGDILMPVSVPFSGNQYIPATFRAAASALAIGVQAAARTIVLRFDLDMVESLVTGGMRANAAGVRDALHGFERVVERVRQRGVDVELLVAMSDGRGELLELGGHVDADGSALPGQAQSR